MREIKFRAWDIGIMFPMAMVGKPANPSVLTGAGWRECADNVVLMQYTGLKDKNGKDVYEGDILKINDWIGAVVYEAPEYKFNDGKSSFSIAFQGFEVIGNIYENPELLTPSPLTGG